jgi:type II secretory pathway component PulK
MTDQQPPWEEQFTPLQEPLSEAKVVALQAAVAMVPHVTIQSSAERINLNVDPGRIVANAKVFEAYLTGDEQP